jgi:hypothetical protein
LLLLLLERSLALFFSRLENGKKKKRNGFGMEKELKEKREEKIAD